MAASRLHGPDALYSGLAGKILCNRMRALEIAYRTAA